MSMNSYISMPYPTYSRPMITSYPICPVLPSTQTVRGSDKQQPSKFNWLWKAAGGIAGCFALERLGIIAELAGCILGYSLVDKLLKTIEENKQLQEKAAQVQCGVQKVYFV